MNAFKSTLVVLASSAVVSGCASIASGTTQTVSFSSTPEGATVTVGGKVLGKTPISAALEKQKNQSVTFTLEGHKPVTVPMTTKLDSWFWADVVLLSPLSTTVDAVTGAMHEYAPAKFYATLVPEGKTPDGKTGRSRYHEIRDYVVFQHEALSRELELGRADGERFSSLAALLGVQENARREALSELSGLSRRHGDAVAFADAVLERYALAP